MLPLTEQCPKPLLKVAGKCLIEHHIEKLVKAGFREIVINVSYLGDMIEEHLGNGERYGASIAFSQEDTPLETGGGLLKALSLIGDEPFLLVNGDVWTDFPFSSLLPRRDIFEYVANNGAYLFLTPNPEHNPKGDFYFCDDERKKIFTLDERQKYKASDGPLDFSTWTYSGISIIHPNLIANYPQRREKFALLEVFKHAMLNQQLFGETYEGAWIDVGTPERLAQVEKMLQTSFQL